MALGTAPVKLTSYLKNVCDFDLSAGVKSDATLPKPDANRMEMDMKNSEGWDVLSSTHRQVKTRLGTALDS